MSMDETIEWAKGQLEYLGILHPENSDVAAGILAIVKDQHRQLGELNKDLAAHARELASLRSEITDLNRLVIRHGNELSELERKIDQLKGVHGS